MINAVKTAADRAQFLAIATPANALALQMRARLALFGEKPASGWQFYCVQNDAAHTCVEDAAHSAPEGATPPVNTVVNTSVPCAAIALRGTRASMVCATGAEVSASELGSFLRFVGVQSLTSAHATPPEGFVCGQELAVYTLTAHTTLPVPVSARAAQCILDIAPPMAPILSLLWGDAPDAQDLRDAYYAEACTARNHGRAEHWLVYEGDVPVFTVSAAAIGEGHAYLAAGETTPALRGQGIGGHYIVQMANRFAARGLQVSFICEPPRAAFYARLGFTKAQILYQHIAQ